MNYLKYFIVKSLKINSTIALFIISAIGFFYGFLVFDGFSKTNSNIATEGKFIGAIMLVAAISLLIWAIFSIIAKTFNLGGIFKIANQVFIKLLLILAIFVFSIFCVYWISNYIYQNGLVIYDEAPYKFIILITISGSLCVACIYVWFILFTKYKKFSTDFKSETVTEKLSIKRVSVERTVQNIDAFNWIMKHQKSEERSILANISGLPKSRFRKTFVFTITLLAFAFLIIFIVLVNTNGVKTPSNNTQNFEYIQNGIYISVIWVIFATLMMFANDYLTFWLALRNLDWTDKQSMAYLYLNKMYDKFNVVEEKSKIDSSLAKYKIYNSRNELLLFEITGSKDFITIRSAHAKDFLCDVKKFLPSNFSFSQESAYLIKFTNKNNISLFLLIFIYTNYWVTNFQKDEVKK